MLAQFLPVAIEELTQIPADERVCAAMSDRRWRTVRRISTATGMSPSNVTHVLDRLLVAGQVSRRWISSSRPMGPRTLAAWALRGAR